MGMWGRSGCVLVVGAGQVPPGERCLSLCLSVGPFPPLDGAGRGSREAVTLPGCWAPSRCDGSVLGKRETTWLECGTAVQKGGGALCTSHWLAVEGKGRGYLDGSLKGLFFFCGHFVTQLFDWNLGVRAVMGKTGLHF